MLEVTPLEDRCVLAPLVPIPTTNPRVALSTIFWNGETKPLNPAGKMNIKSPAAAGAMKTVTLRNNGIDTIFPFMRGQNSGIDPNAKPKGPYDPQDVAGREFRVYVGYRSGGKEYLGLPKGASITVQVPLALWDGNNLYIGTNGKYLTHPKIFGYDPKASITVAATNTVSGTVWVQGSSKFPSGTTPLVMFYFSRGAPITVPDDAPAQLTELTFRDQYLKQFINDPNQTFPLLNYDVSYVNNIVSPVAMAASRVPITYYVNGITKPPKYYGYQDFGWLATKSNVAAFTKGMDNFIKNVGTASIGQYFGGKGWPAFYNPDGDLNIPSGANLFADSPLTTGSTLVHTSTFDSNRWMLTSNGSAPIQAGGAGVGQQGFVNAGDTKRIYLNSPSAQFVSDLQEMLKVGVVNVSFPGSPTALAQVTAIEPKPQQGMPFVTLKSDVPVSGTSGKIYAFTRTASDYAITAITNLWYSWARYYVKQFDKYTPQSVQASLNFITRDNVKQLTNKITLATLPSVALARGMTVTGQGIPTGTFILDVKGKDVFLSQIPNDNTPQSQKYTFGKPAPLQFDPKYTTPFDLSFNAAAAPNAKLFAGSVYAAMAAQAPVVRTVYLPFSMELVHQVINFYAKLPGYTRPFGPALVGQIRDVVKSILRGVYDFNAVPDQTKWYPDPSKVPTGLTSGQKFNVFNLDPYVWFVHQVQKMSGYGFSVDDDVSNPTGTGPISGPTEGSQNHTPNDLQIGFGGIDGFDNQKQWFPTIPWGSIATTATIGIQQSGDFKGQYVIKLAGADALKLFNQINNPGDGQLGAYVTAPGYIVPGTTLIHKGPTSGLIPEIVLSQKALKTIDTPIPINIFADQIPTLATRPRTRRRV